jgi:integral membrane protein (TIGR01906 family)
MTEPQQAAASAVPTRDIGLSGRTFPGERLPRLVTALVIALALPFLLIGANLDLLTNSGWLYSYNWWRNSIPEATGLEKSELDGAAKQIKTYFSTPQSEGLLDVKVKFGQQEVSLYSDREILHMRDVKTLLRGFWSAGQWSGVAVSAGAAAGLAVLRGRFWRVAATAAGWSAIGSGVAILVIGAAALINFGALFRLFHVLSFANDLWRLSPFTDYLIIMFPQRFWLEATLLLGVLTVAEFAGLWLVLRWISRATG